MGHAHEIGRPHRHGAPVAAATTRRLTAVLALTAGFAVAEVIGGIVSRSLALLADATHMLTDIMALSLALLAAWTARRPPDTTRTYGYQRVEILAALLNGLALVVISIFIFLEAWERVRDPPEVAFRTMAVIAAGGLLVNLICLRVLGSDHSHGLNVRAAYLHILGDLLGSIGALTAALLIGLFGWMWADPAVSAVIGTIIIVSAVRLVLESVHVLLEGAPSHLDTEDVRHLLETTPGVSDVHDLHLWSLGGRSPLLTAHLVLDLSVPANQVLRGASVELERRFGITHSTLQLEPPDYNIIQELTSVE